MRTNCGVAASLSELVVCCPALCLTLLPWHYWVSCPPIAHYSVKWPRRPTIPLLCRPQTSLIAPARPYSTLRGLHFPRDGHLLVVAALHVFHTSRRLGNGNVRKIRNPTLSGGKRLVPPGVSASRCRSESVSFHSVRAASEW